MQAFEDDVERRRREVMAQEAKGRATLPFELSAITVEIDRAIVIATENYIQGGHAFAYIYFGKDETERRRARNGWLPDLVHSLEQQAQISQYLHDQRKRWPAWKITYGPGADWDYWYILVSRK